ncbi:hypothetical protein [Nitrosomonas ureae]|uniref:Uncharacterized protein n=1 Tax=Nitrosomonas ureae TaxID=44577 RepID=A0A2T5ISV4_9PROT|nr:hypothetical protein [Nitrosomonas ureae]PTQ86920.1 hypothetical protein C8R28_1008115 [Nitrosomonas ureae]
MINAKRKPTIQETKRCGLNIVNVNNIQQEVINILRDWVFNRDGEAFCMNDLFNAPEFEGKLDKNIRTMLLIDRALITLHCTFKRDEENAVTFSELLYTPPKIKRIHRDELYS